jgi:hypothetical protein
MSRLLSVSCSHEKGLAASNMTKGGASCTIAGGIPYCWRTQPVAA